MDYMSNLQSALGPPAPVEGRGLSQDCTIWEQNRGDMPDYSNPRVPAYCRSGERRRATICAGLSNPTRRLTIDWRHQVVTLSTVTRPGPAPNMGVRDRWDEHESRATLSRLPSRFDMAPMVNPKAGDAPGGNRDRMMAAAQAGDADAYGALLAELAPWLRRYYLRRLPPVRYASHPQSSNANRVSRISASRTSVTAASLDK